MKDNVLDTANNVKTLYDGSLSVQKGTKSVFRKVEEGEEALGGVGRGGIELAVEVS